jgi:hypothetical protein
MKKLMLLIFCFLIGCASVMTPDQMQRSMAVNLPGLQQDAIYQKSLQFVLLYFQSSEGVAQYHNPKEGKIIQKGWIRAEGWSVDVTLSIDATDNQARISVIPMSWWGGSPIYTSEYRSYKMEREQRKIMDAYNNYMVKIQ